MNLRSTPMWWHYQKLTWKRQGNKFLSVSPEQAYWTKKALFQCQQKRCYYLEYLSSSSLSMQFFLLSSRSCEFVSKDKLSSSIWWWQTVINSVLFKTMLFELAIHVEHIAIWWKIFLSTDMWMHTWGLPRGLVLSPCHILLCTFVV